MKESPLVSIIVITYNSSKYIIETLESVKTQTYKNIELIVSDDCSTDDTIEICKNWIANNNIRFAQTKLIESNQNTGIPGNCNRGLKELRGKIVKIIAGDDCFFEGAFEQVVEVFSKDIEIKVLQTRGCFYNDTFEENNFMHRWERSKNFDFFGMNAKKQYKTLKYRNYIFTPGMFFDSEVFKNLAFDEEFRKLEDYPFWIMLTKNNFKFYFSELITVKYRVHKDSIQNDGLEYTSNDKLLTTIKIQKKNYQSAFIILKILIKINSLELNPKLLKKIHILISRLIIYFNYIHTRII